MKRELAELFCTLDKTLKLHQTPNPFRMDDTLHGVEENIEYGVICDDLLTISNIILKNVDKFAEVDPDGSVWCICSEEYFSSELLDEDVYFVY